MELKIDDCGERDSVAKKLMGIGNRDPEHIYIKRDGSLNEGIEIVTHPMTLDYHKAQMPWAAVMEAALAEGYYSHCAETCGLHVHVNRDSFGKTEEAQETVIARIIFFVKNHCNELLRFSRRTKRQMEKWAWKDSSKEVLDSAKTSCAGCYACVNLTNYRHSGSKTILREAAVESRKISVKSFPLVFYKKYSAQKIWQTKRQKHPVPYGIGCSGLFSKVLKNSLFPYFLLSATATATATVAPTMGLLPMPRKPIISTWAGTELDPANCASECIRPMVSVMP